ncbi:ATP-binding protein [Rothia nasimurium]
MRIKTFPGHMLLVALPSLAALASVLVAGTPAPAEACGLLLLVALLTLAALRFAGERPSRMRTVANLIEALREGDYGVRAVEVAHDPLFADLAHRFNELAQRLQDEQRSVQENLQLLSKTLAALDGAVFAFEQGDRLRLVNPAAERLLGRDAGELLGNDVASLGLDALFDVPSGDIVAHGFPMASGRWQIVHGNLRSRSQEGRLLVVQPMERALREEEAQAFRRLLRVLSHEINNSMGPIASLVDTLQGVLPPPGLPLGDELHDDLRHGLQVIARRSDALQRFIGGYARLARLPPPQSTPVDVETLCHRVAALFDDRRIFLAGGPALQLNGDADQLEQVLINVLRNAIEAGGDAEVRLAWSCQARRACIVVSDGGPGLPASGSLFVPFFTTKPHGAGIGLALSRQIVEAQGGSLELISREDAQGAVARITLPLWPATPD